MKCYDRALQLAEEHGVDVGEHHDRILEALCKLTEKHLEDGVSAYATINVRMHNRIHQMSKKVKLKEVPSGLVKIEEEPIWSPSELDMKVIFDLLKTKLTEDEFNSFYHYYLGYGYAEAGAILGRQSNVVRLHVEKSLRRLRSPEFIKFYTGYNYELYD